MDSALDTRDYDGFGAVAASHQRRMSSVSTRQPPNTKADQHLSSPVMAARRRAVSVMNRATDVAHSFASPLAQIFQPLVVDEGMPEEPTEAASADTPPSVSYGPASRQKLSLVQSLHKKPSTDLQGDQVLSPLRRLPLAPLGVRQESEGDSPQLDSAEPQDSEEPETAGQVEEDETNVGGVAQWARRLSKIEHAQNRIEEMLIQISKDMNGQASQRA